MSPDDQQPNSNSTPLESRLSNVSPSSGDIETNNASSQIPGESSPVSLEAFAPPQVTESVPEAQPPLVKTKPRLWTVFLTMVSATLIYISISTLCVVIGVIILSASGTNVNMVSQQVLLDSLMTLPGAVLLLIVPAHLGILAITIIAAVLSPSPFTSRLALTRPNWPWWVTIATVLAAPFCSYLWSIVVAGLFDSSEYLDQMSEMFKSNSDQVGFIVTLICIAAVPAFSEEWLFRGYIQSRLAQRWSPWLAILVSSVLFAGFHMDPTHVIAVFPLGIWLGFVSYRCASIIPAMLAHAYNNTLSLVAVVFEQSEALDTSVSTITNQLIIFLGMPGLLIFIAYLVATYLRKPEGNLNTPVA